MRNAEIAECFDLFESLGNEFLPAPAGVHAHKKDHVRPRFHGGKGLFDRRFGIDDGGFFYAVRGNFLKERGDIAGFHVNSDIVCARPCKVLDVRLGVQNHQVAIEGKGGMRTDRLHRLRAEGDGWHEIPVHDVAVHEICAASLEQLHRFPEL